MTIDQALAVLRDKAIDNYLAGADVHDDFPVRAEVLDELGITRLDLTVDAPPVGDPCLDCQDQE